MKKILPKIILCSVLALTALACFLYFNNVFGISPNHLEEDIRSSQKISDYWTVDGEVSDTMAAFISYPPNKTDHTYSVYIKHQGLSFGYFFRTGGDIVSVDKYITKFTMNECDEIAFISMNSQQVERLEIDDGDTVQVIDIDSSKPFAIVLPANVGNIVNFYDVNGNTVEYIERKM